MRTIFRNLMAGALLAAACSRGLAGGSGAASLAPQNAPNPRRQGAATSSRTLIGLQYETFFTPHNVSWDASRTSGSVGLYSATAEAIPILGKYSSFDVNILRKHEEWFEYQGIDWLLIDWTNFLIAKPDREQHTGATREAEETTELLFRTYVQLPREGRHPPKLVFMMPLFKSAVTIPIGIRRLNVVIDWANKNFLDKPKYKDLWLNFDGKPLMLIP